MVLLRTGSEKTEGASIRGNCRFEGSKFSGTKLRGKMLLPGSEVEA